MPVKSRVAIALRLLAGASYTDIVDKHGVSIAPVYCRLSTVVDGDGTPLTRVTMLDLSAFRVARKSVASARRSLRCEVPIQSSVPFSYTYD